MKLRTAILLTGLLAGIARAQNPDVIQDTRSTLQNVQKKQVIDQNAVLTAAGQTAATATPKAQPVTAQLGTAATTAKATTTAKTATKTVARTSTKPVAHKATQKSKSTPVDAASTDKTTTKTVAVEDNKAPAEPKKETKTYSAGGRRDPFVSPVVTRSMVANGCSSGKRCLAIDQIILTGIVKSESGMIAVVVNAVNKAYFLRENDPVFNGYVVKITGDSIVFQETVQDNLGKPLTKEVTKKISTPAV